MTPDSGFTLRKLMLNVLTGVLWLLTAVLGVLCIVYGHDVLVELISRLFGQIAPQEDVVRARGTVVTIYNCTLILLWLAWLALVVGGAEYHFRRVGQRRSYRLFAWTLGIELVILLPVILNRLL